MELKMIVKISKETETVFDRLYQNYQSESSPITGNTPSPEGLYSLDYKSFEDYEIFLIYKNTEQPAGFAIIKSTPQFEVLDYFIAPTYRRQTLGMESVKEIIALHDGEWIIKQPLESTKAVGFWHKIIKHLTKGDFNESTLYDKRWGRALVQTFNTAK